MDHVNNQSGLGGSYLYPDNDAVDPSLIPWDESESSYANQSFNAQQAYPPQYAAPPQQSSPYGGYQMPQQSTPYATESYAAQYQSFGQPNPLHQQHYSGSGQGQSFSPNEMAYAQAAFPAARSQSNNPYLFQNQPAQGSTVTPAALQQYAAAQSQSSRANSRAPPQSAGGQAQSGSGSYVQQNWGPPYAAQQAFYQTQPSTVTPERRQTSTVPASGQARNLAATTTGNAPRSVLLPTSSTPTPTTRLSTSRAEKRKPRLRIVGANTLNSQDLLPFQKLAVAKYSVISSRPVDLRLAGKLTVPKLKPLKNKSGNDIFAAVESKNSAASRPASAPKIKEAKPKQTKQPSLSQEPARKSRDIAAKTTSGTAVSPIKPESSSSDEETLDESSEEEEEMAYPELSDVRQAIRPTDIAGAAGWDATGAVWIPQWKLATQEEIGAKIQEFYDLITGLRDATRQVTADLAKAEAEKQPNEIKRLKAAREVQRKALFCACSAAARHGHKDVLEHLSDNQKLVNCLTTVLIDCVKSEDYTGELPKAVLELMTRFKTLTEDLMAKLKFEKVRKRLDNRGDDAVKKSLHTILSNASKGKEAKPAKDSVDVDQKKGGADEPANLKKPDPSKSAVSSSSLKRSHDGDGSNGKPAKKVASDVASKPSAAKPGAVSVKKVTPTSSNFFSGLTRSTKPSPAAKAGATTAGAVRAPAPQSSLAAILADIEKPKEVPKRVQTPPRPPETPEEKKRRERKESRRHLRVRFKPDEELEEVRLFKHEQAEDEGRQDDMLRHAHDEHAEGMMHKLRMKEEKLDEEEEERGFLELLPIDFSPLPEDRRANNYATRGGKVAERTKFQDAQEKREAMELMVVYTDPRDIPPSPKEPTVAEPASVSSVFNFASPTAPWVLQRFRDVETIDPDTRYAWWAYRTQQGDFSTSPDPSKPSQPSPQQQQASAPTSEQLTFEQQHAQLLREAAPNPGTMDPTIVENLSRWVGYLMTQPHPATQPPEWMRVRPDLEASWREGYERDKALEAANARAAQSTYAPQPAQLPAQMQASMGYPAGPAQMQAPNNQHWQAAPPSASGAVPDIAAQVQAVLANLNKSNDQGVGQQQAQHQQQGQAWYGGNSGGNYGGNYDSVSNNADRSGQAYGGYPSQDQQSGANNYYQDYASGQYGDQQQQYGGQYGDRDSEQRDGRGGHNNHHKKRKHDGFGERGGGNKRGGGHFGLDQNHPLAKTKPCRFFQEGKCAKGDKCTYRHDM